MGAFARFVVVALDGWCLSVQPEAISEDFFVLISVAMTAYGLVTETAVWLGALD